MNEQYLSEDTPSFPSYGYDERSLSITFS